MGCFLISFCLGNTALPFRHRLTADAERLRDKFLRHVAGRAAAAQHFAERFRGRGLFLPHRGAAQIFPQGADEQHDEIAEYPQNEQRDEQNGYDGFRCHEHGDSLLFALSISKKLRLHHQLSRNRSIFLHFFGLLRLFLAQHQAAERKRRTKPHHRRHGFVQDERGRDDGDNGRGVDVNARAHRPQKKDRAVPCHEAGRARKQAEKQQVCQMHRRAPRRNSRRQALDSGRDEQEQQAVAENAAGQRNGLIPHRAEHADDDRVDAPDERRADGQQRAGRAEMQLAHPGERHERHACHGADKAEEEPPRQLFLQHRRRDERGEQRRRRHDYADKRGGDIGQRDILHQKIQRHAGKPRRREQHLVPLLLRAHEAAPGDKQREKAERKSRDHDFNGRKGAQQHLGGDEGRAPDEHAERAEQVSLQAMIVLCILHIGFL